MDKIVYRVYKNAMDFYEKKVVRESEHTYWYSDGKNERKHTDYHNVFETKEEALLFIKNRLDKSQELLNKQQQRLNEDYNKLKLHFELHKINK